MTSPAVSPTWSAPTPSRPVDATVTVPGSKSLTNRAYVLAALATEPTVIHRPLESRDTQLMRDALAALGARMTEQHDGSIRVSPLRAEPEPAQGPGARQGPDAVSIALGNSGTVARFTPAVAALGTARAHFDGDAALRRRPLAPLLHALGELGAAIDGGPGDGGLGVPFTVHGRGRVAGGHVTVDSSASSQFLSALLLAGPAFDAGLSVRLTGAGPPSEPHIAMTLDLLRAFGAAPTREDRELRVEPGPLHRAEYTVEPDLSSTVPFLAAAVLTGGRVAVPGWPAQTIQPGDRVRSLLTELGAEVELNEQGLVVTGTGAIPGVELDLHDLSELTPVLAALLCFADGPSRIRGVAHLRGHETDRLAALASELSALGGRVSQTGDGLHIVPSKLTAGIFHTYDDHRLVMAAALLGLRVPGITVANPATVGKTFPEFCDRWEAMAASGA